MIKLTPYFYMIMESDLPEEKKIKIVENLKKELNNHPFFRLLNLFKPNLFKLKKEV